MMEHYDIQVYPSRMDNSLIKYTAKVKWNDEIKSILEFDDITEDYTKAECGCCGVDYAWIPSDLNSIIERGYCSWCILYRDGKFDYINAYRHPSYAEVNTKLDLADEHTTFSALEVQTLLKGNKL